MEVKLPTPTPIEIRAAIIANYENEFTQEEIADEHGIHQSTVSKILKQYKNEGHVIPGKAHGRKPKFKESDHLMVKQLILDNPDKTLAAYSELISNRLGIQAGRSVLARLLDKLKLKRKKKTRIASERDRPDVKKKRRLPSIH